MLGSSPNVEPGEDLAPKQEADQAADPVKAELGTDDGFQRVPRNEAAVVDVKEYVVRQGCVLRVEWQVERQPDYRLTFRMSASR